MLGEFLTQLHTEKPLLHCIMNQVTANDCANLALACGASPIMAEDPEEVEQVVSSCRGLVLNLGTPSPSKIKALLLAGKCGKSDGKPVVFDPVGAGCSDFRRTASSEIVAQVRPDIIRGNVGEIRTLLLGSVTNRGVDAEDRTEDPLELGKALAEKTHAIVVVSGDTDVITDGKTSFRVYNGHPMMRSVTGTGCQLSVLIGAFVAAAPGEMLHRTLAAVCAYGLCGELAFRRLAHLDGNASYRNYIIDAVYHLTGEELEKGARYEIC